MEEPCEEPILKEAAASTPTPGSSRGRALSVFALMLGATGVAAVARSSWDRAAAAAELDAEAVNGHGLYHCKNGYSDVPKAYRSDSWGDLTGDWQRGTTGVVFWSEPRLEFTESRSCRSW